MTFATALLNAMRTFLEPQFKYCPLRVSQQSVLMIFYSASKLTFLELLDIDGSFYVHDENACTSLVLEIYKRCSQSCSLITMNEIFKINIFCLADRFNHKMAVRLFLNEILHRRTSTGLYNTTALPPMLKPVRYFSNITGVGVFET